MVWTLCVLSKYSNVWGNEGKAVGFVLLAYILLCPPSSHKPKRLIDE